MIGEIVMSNINGTGVLTPNGYVPIETLKVGDKVFDDSGYIQSVVDVYPQGKKQGQISHSEKE